VSKILVQLGLEDTDIHLLSALDSDEIR
jgi:hypothetical protein